MMIVDTRQNSRKLQQFVEQFFKQYNILNNFLFNTALFDLFKILFNI